MSDFINKTIEFEYTYQITTEMILMLMQGKKINFEIMGKGRFTFYPPKEGVFISNKQFYALKSTSNNAQEHIFHEIENE